MPCEFSFITREQLIKIFLYIYIYFHSLSSLFNFNLYFFVKPNCNLYYIISLNICVYNFCCVCISRLQRLIFIAIFWRYYKSLRVSRLFYILIIVYLLGTAEHNNSSRERYIRSGFDGEDRTLFDNKPDGAWYIAAEN